MKCVPTRLQTTLLLPLALCALHARAGVIDIDTPQGGWRFSEKNEAGFQQQLQYPASNVNTAGIGEKNWIKGRIASHQKGKPATLIVNGVAMPLQVQEDGSYARPYAFGRGSNSVEVRGRDGQRQRMQFYEARDNRLQARLRVVLSWDTGDNDLDLHVVSPDGQHVFYAARTADNGGALDVDVTTGYGPEIYANPTPPHGLYHVYVNYYGAGQDKEQVTMVNVTIITNENTVNEKQQSFRVPMRKPGELTLVKSFYY